MRKNIKNKVIMLGLAALLVVVASAKAAQEPEQKQEQERNLSPAAMQELVALCDDIKKLTERARIENHEAVESHIAMNQKELEELEARLRAEGKSEEEIQEAGTVFIDAFELEGKALLEQQKTNVKNRIKELLVARAPTLLAEDPDLKRILKRG
jgi:hypothetical protein